MTLLKKSLVAGFTLAGLMLSGNAAAIAQAAPDNTTLKFALVFSRHGVRPPTKDERQLQPLTPRRTSPTGQSPQASSPCMAPNS